MLVMGPGRYRFKHYLSIGSGMAASEIENRYTDQREGALSSL
jgi:hypothetical protein